jgi:predicted phage terminase large subunit-like protein
MPARTELGPLTVDQAHAIIRASIRRASILDAIPTISPHFQRPQHMRPLARLLRRCHDASIGKGPPVFACLSAPPQVGKTETIQHALAWWLARSPGDFLGYVSYGSDLAETKSRRVRDLAGECGVELRTDSRAVDLWQTTSGGGLLARGLGAGITGQSALKLIVVDDPYKNRIEAESRRFRDRIRDDFRAVIWTRRHPTTSIVVCHTRFHEDDLTGSLVREGWEHHVIRAIDDEGRPLWPESGRDLAFWEATRKGASEYNWWSLYQGEPRPREGRLFSGVQYGDAPSDCTVALGLDLAYSAKTSADYSVAVAVAHHAPSGRYFVLDVLREQLPAPEFAQRLKTWRSRWPGAPLHAYLAGTERGTADFIRTLGIVIKVDAPKGDKFMRAQSASAAWNDGRVLVPASAPWVEHFVGELLDFSGVADAHDDQLDAFVSAFDHAARVQLAAVPSGALATSRAWDREQRGGALGLAPPAAQTVLAPRRRYQ